MARKVLAVFAAAVSLAAGMLLGPAAPASAAAPVPLTCALPGTAAPSAYYLYRVTGSVTDPNVPSSITVVTTHQVLRIRPASTYTYTAITNAAPVLDNSYASGAYLAQGYNAWKLGAGSDGTPYWLLLPSTPMGGAPTTAQVVGPGGLTAGTCRAPGLLGNTGAFTCSAQDKYNFWTIKGTIVAPENPTQTVVIDQYHYRPPAPPPVVVGSDPLPVLDNTFMGGYWLTTYGWNSWPVTSATTQAGGYWLLVPDATLSKAFSGEFVITYTSGGSVQDGASCTFG